VKREDFKKKKRIHTRNLEALNNLNSLIFKIYFVIKKDVFQNIFCNFERCSDPLHVNLNKSWLNFLMSYTLIFKVGTCFKIQLAQAKRSDQIPFCQFRHTCMMKGEYVSTAFESCSQGV